MDYSVITAENIGEKIDDVCRIIQRENSKLESVFGIHGGVRLGFGLSDLDIDSRISCCIV